MDRTTARQKFNSIADPETVTAPVYTSSLSLLSSDGITTSEIVLSDLVLAIRTLDHPVGSIFFSTSATNPATSLGFGTWEAFGAGRVIVGAGTGTDANSTSTAFSSEGTGGEYSHTLTSSEMPSHRHSIPAYYGGDVTESSSGDKVLYNSDGSTAVDYTNYTGSSGAHTNVQPWIGAYVWRRTA